MGSTVSLNGGWNRAVGTAAVKSGWHFVESLTCSLPARNCAKRRVFNSNLSCSHYSTRQEERNISISKITICVVRTTFMHIHLSHCPEMAFESR
jgi:hypothetical protein